MQVAWADPVDLVLHRLWQIRETRVVLWQQWQADRKQQSLQATNLDPGDNFLKTD